MSLTRIVPIFALAATFTAPLAAGAQTTTASPAPAASAAPTTGHHHRHHHQSLTHALQSLNLTDAQKQQIATFRSQAQQADQNADSDTKHANAAKMRGQIMGILTPDQKAQLQAQMHHRSDAGTAPAPNAVRSPAAQ